MAPTTKTGRRRPIAFRPTAAAVCAAGVLALTLSGCNGTGGGSDNGGAKPGAGHTAAAADPSGGATAVGAKPAAKSSAGTGTGGKPTAAAPAPAASKASSTPIAAGTGGPDDGCDHKMPISPDEIAVYRYTPEGGSLNLIVKYGNWGCPTADSDGAPFETVGKETYLPMDQAAYVTATNPVVDSTENQHIGVQEFLDWLEAHPDSGLVFKYHLGADGAIDRLEEVFTP
ncbi:hypothetical protein [Streptomyces sp. NPDC058964]|uniref:hypothetical protein n=1 Tax=Streptomyces sp. NPDC058964 TaxID=3346681 RepID=UPI0036815DB8